MRVWRWRLFFCLYLGFLFVMGGCDEAADIGCVAQCEDRACGSDGCGGFCGVCGEGMRCRDFQCVSTCEPQCEGRECGSDSCGGLCGHCEEGFTCNEAHAMCKSIRPRMRGALHIEKRVIERDERQGFIFSKETEWMPAVDVELSLRDRNGEEWGRGVTNEEGHFEWMADRPVRKTDWISIVPLWEQNGDPILTMLRARVAQNPVLWSWRFDIGEWGAEYDWGHVGELKLSIKEGSGAMYGFLHFKRAMKDLAQYLHGGDATALKKLAVLWAPGVSWDCGACYIHASPQYLGETRIAAASIYIGGIEREESIWGYPTLLHEFGHYVCANAKDDTPGGFHTFGTLTVPTLAWSEGWATFYALMSLSRGTGENYPVYWRILEKGSFWVDYNKYQGSFKMLKPTLDNKEGVRQYLDESWVTSALWHLWEDNENADFSDALSYQSMMDALYSERYIKKDRGFRKTDFIDYIDALVCQDDSLITPMTQWLHDQGFPYDGQPLCFSE